MNVQQITLHQNRAIFRQKWTTKMMDFVLKMVVFILTGTTAAKTRSNTTGQRLLYC